MTTEVWDDDLRSTNPLGFDGYHAPDPDRESVRTALVTLHGRQAVWIDCDFRRVGGTMGAVAGERIVRAFDRATARRVPVVQTVSSGGARLQEGMVALLQMPRTVSAAARHAAAGLITASYLHSPTTGGVFASVVAVADLRAAEPGAVIGFGGPRVVATVTGQRPPATSHTAESALAHGLVDAVVEPGRRWEWLAAAIGGPNPWRLAPPPDRPAVPAPGALRPAAPLGGDAWAHLQRTRSRQRPSGLEWAVALTDSWLELAGSDPSVRAGLATVDGRPTVVVAMDRYGGTRPGHPGPGAYRLAQRAIRLAGRLGLPVLTLVDTPGADPAPESEAGGIAREIGQTLLAMAELASAAVCLVVGEGGSGGAVALAHTDRLIMLDGAVFSVIGPEAGASILHRDTARAPQLAAALRMTPAELHALGVVDQIVTEDVAAVRAAVTAALAGARPGDRDVRADRVTATAVLDGAARADREEKGKAS